MNGASGKKIYVIGGANGAGKTTAAMILLPDFLGLNEFVNADEIARGLSPLNPSGADVAAGRIMLERMNDLITSGQSFAYETTCSGLTHARMIERAKQKGYEVNLLFLWVPNADLSIERVRNRVRMGGHNIPESVIKTRYLKGIKNLIHLYLPLCNNTMVYDARGFIDGHATVIASKSGNSYNIFKEKLWSEILKVANG